MSRANQKSLTASAGSAYSSKVMADDQAPAPPQGRGKNKVVAGVLGILLGGFGIHHFYLGSNGSGAILLAIFLGGMVVAVLTCGFGSPIPMIAGILGLVEGILLLVMDDAEFDRRYNQRSPQSVEFVFMKKK
jgi:TM2 domain-containing membrane protein YozV